jgi:arylsulfatase A-like enzyme
MKTLYSLILIACVILCGCGREPERINVLLIGVDTLRPDHLGCYGYGRNTSPNIDRLAGGGVLFEHVVSQCPWTLPSFATVLTSLYPSQHGAGINMGKMRTSFPTLAEILGERGYAAGAIINVSVLRPEFGVDRGFDYYDTTEPGAKRLAPEVTEEALEWIAGNKDGPFFLFVHYFDPHLSYAAPAPYDTLFDSDYRGRIGNTFDQEAYEVLAPVLFDEDDPQMEADWGHIEALYDGEIAYTDEAVGSLLEGLADMGLTQKTLIVFLSDHGEEFFEHKGYGHGHTLYQEVINVPLIFSLPGILPQGVRAARQVRLVDVTPSVLDLLGIDTEAGFEGVSLKSLLTGEGESGERATSLFPPEAAFSEGLRRGGERKGVTAYPWKLVYHVPTGSEMLFNLRDDPAETQNVTDRGYDASSLLEEMLFKSLLSMSDVWYVEMAGGEAQRDFDIRISAGSDEAKGKVYFHRFWDGEGRIFRPAEEIFLDETGWVLRIEGLRPDSTIALAFTVDGPPGMTVEFDLRIDGEPAPERTFLGESFKSPQTMPFSRRKLRAKTKAASGPAGRPDAPYFVVWHSSGGHGPVLSADLGDDLKADLRALGYIQ